LLNSDDALTIKGGIAESIAFSRLAEKHGSNYYGWLCESHRSTIAKLAAEILTRVLCILPGSCCKHYSL